MALTLATGPGPPHFRLPSGPARCDREQGASETGSWLGQAHQGRGFSKEMRRASLSLGYERLNLT